LRATWLLSAVGRKDHRRIVRSDYMAVYGGEFACTKLPYSRG
jgi:hypothetical protein